MDEAWAINELKAFIAKCEEDTGVHDRGGEFAYKIPAVASLKQDAMSRLYVIRKIADEVWPDWRDHEDKNANYFQDYASMVDISRTLIVVLERSAELAEKLGDSAPKLSASHLHEWVWDSAKTLWKSGHYRDAVAAAARGVNAQTQAKVSRRDISEVDLFKQCFP
jgi:Protein of unknown function (Hypoth_ymh)